MCTKTRVGKMTERLYVPAEGPDVEALNIALYSASILASERDSEITLVVPALKYVNGTIINQCITEVALKKLTKGEVLQYQKVPSNDLFEDAESLS